MKDAIVQLLDKISPYQVFCNFLPGFLVVNGFCYLSSVALCTHNFFETCIIYYFFGVVVSRIGSVVIEAIFRRFKWIEYAPYNDYLTSLAKDSSLADLSRESNMYRSLLTGSVIVLVIHVANRLYPINWCSGKCFAAFLAVLVLLFSLAWIKQVRYIKKRIDKFSK